MEALNGFFLISPSPLTTTPFAPSKRCRRHCRDHPFSVEVGQQEIRVCTNWTYRKQGSFQNLETLSGLAPPNVAVKPCGCLGKGGAGPNLAVLPDAFIVDHCGTASRAAEVMMGLVSVGEGLDSYYAKKSLDALALRKRAELLLSQALHPLRA